MAGPWYLRSSDGNDGDDGLSWANACATMLGLLGKAVAAGDIIYVDDDHSETFAADVTWAFPGTEGVPNKVITVITDTTSAVSGYAVGSYFGHATSYGLAITGEVFFWGVTLQQGKYKNIVSGGKTFIMENCHLKIDKSVYQARQTILGSNTVLYFINSDVSFLQRADHGFELVNGGLFVWYKGALLGASDIDVLISAEDYNNIILIKGVDLSPMNGGSIINVAATDEAINAKILGVKLHANNPDLISASPERMSQIYMDIADDGNTIYKFRREFQYGYAMQETLLTVAGKGLYDGSNPYSVKLTSRASPTPTFYDPWRYHLATKRVTGLGSGKTFTVYVLENGNGGQPAAWNNDQVWLEVVYPDNTTAQYNIQTDKKATPTTAAAEQTADAGRWQNETNGRELRLEVTVANGAGKDGPVEIWVCVAQANKTLYVCPEVIVS